jgi:hypothetical protein
MSPKAKMNDLFSKEDYIDKEIVKSRKNMRKLGFTDDEVLLHLFCYRLSITGQRKYIPHVTWQMSMISGKKLKTPKL